MRNAGRANRRSTYMREKTGMGEKEVTAEIERYIVNPGQACAYKVGMLKIAGTTDARAKGAGAEVRPA